MLSRLQVFMTRHRRKLIVTSVIIGGSLLAFKYAQRKLIDFQEKQAKDFFEKTRRIQHFESTERTCNQVILGMGAELTFAILRECSTDELLEKLRQKAANKVELWEEIKIIAFTRLSTLVYASSMLVVALRVQMNVLGGYLYRDILSDEKKLSDDIKQQYLSLIRYFIQDNGLKDLIKFIRTKVTEIIGPLPLTKKLTLTEIEQLFWSIQLSLSSDTANDPNSKMSKYLMNNQFVEYDVSSVFNAMYSETLDLLESDDAINICASNISRGFSLATDAIAESLSETIKLVHGNHNATLNKTDSVKDTFTHSSSNKASKSHNSYKITSMETVLAKIIPIVSGITSRGYNSNISPFNLATSLISFYVVAEKNKVLGANIYENFCNPT